MKKTPIMELIDYLGDVKLDILQPEFWEKKQPEYWLQKEKSFAFDCFKAGMIHNHDQMICSSFQDETTFDQFYSQYAEQNNKNIDCSVSEDIRITIEKAKDKVNLYAAKHNK